MSSSSFRTMSRLCRNRLGFAFLEEHLCSSCAVPSLTVPLQVTKRMYFCFSVTQDCLQLIADNDTPTIRKGNESTSPNFSYTLVPCKTAFRLHLKSAVCLQTSQNQM